MALLSQAYTKARSLSQKNQDADQAAAKPRINPQTQSPFFSRLPPEIRQQIYQLVLQVDGIVGLYLVSWWPRRLGGRRELQPSGVSRGYPAKRPLSLVRSCRRANEEAYHILYSINTFQLVTPDALKALAESRAGPSLRSLRFSWALNEPPPLRGQKARFIRPEHSMAYWISAEEWESAWATLASLTDLKQLHVEIMALDRWLGEWSKREHQLLQPLQGLVSSGTSACLVLTWPQDKSQDEVVERLLDGWTITRHYHFRSFFITVGPTVGGRSQDQTQTVQS